MRSRNLGLSTYQVSCTPVCGMNDVMINHPGSPAPGCYERLAAMRRKRANSVNGKIFGEAFQKRFSKERRKYASSNEIDDCPCDVIEGSSENIAGWETKEQTLGRNTHRTECHPAQYSWSTTPRPKRIKNKKGRTARSGSVPNVSFLIDGKTLHKVSPDTFYAPSTRHTRNSSDVSTRVEKRCLQLLMEELDSSPSGKTSKAKRKDVCEAKTKDASTAKGYNRRRSLPAIFSLGKETSTLSLFKRSASGNIDQTDSPKSTPSKSRNKSAPWNIFGRRKNVNSNQDLESTQT